MSRFIQLPMSGGTLWVDPRRIVAIVPQDPRAKPVTSFLHIEGAAIPFAVNLTPEEIEVKIDRVLLGYRVVESNELLGKPIG